MVKFHGTPLTPISVFNEVVPTRNILVSWANPQDINRACDQCDKLILDNGAFTFWSKKKKVNWDRYYEWLIQYYDRIECFFIPDIIDGAEKENDDLIEQYFKENIAIERMCDIWFNIDFKPKGVPVWHIHESFERLEKLMRRFDYIAIGSSGEYNKLGTQKWHNRMNEAMKVICDKNGYPKVKIHMLRCLDPKIFTKYPFYSGDSTNVARNHNRKGWKPIMNRIEHFDSPEKYEFVKYVQKELF